MCSSSQERIMSSFRRTHSSGIMRLRYKVGLVMEILRLPVVYGFLYTNSTINWKESQRIWKMCTDKKTVKFVYIFLNIFFIFWTEMNKMLIIKGSLRT